MRRRYVKATWRNAVAGARPSARWLKPDRAPLLLATMIGGYNVQLPWSAC